MKTQCLCLAALVILGTVKTTGSDKTAETEPDFQLRVPFHLQLAGLRTNNFGSFGLAVWNVFPDVTAKDNETANLCVLGPLWNYGKKGSWVEVMGGFKRNESGYIDPVVDLRFLDKSLSKLNLGGEIAYFPRDRERRLYTWITADTSLSIGKYKVRVGVESENIFFGSDKESSLGIGPRLVLPIPLTKFSPALFSSLAVTYQCRNDRDFVRCYLGLTYVFRKK